MGRHVGQKPLDMAGRVRASRAVDLGFVELGPSHFQGAGGALGLKFHSCPIDDLPETRSSSSGSSGNDHHIHTQIDVSEAGKGLVVASSRRDVMEGSAMKVRSPKLVTTREGIIDELDRIYRSVLFYWRYATHLPDMEVLGGRWRDDNMAVWERRYEKYLEKYGPKSAYRHYIEYMPIEVWLAVEWGLEGDVVSAAQIKCALSTARIHQSAMKFEREGGTLWATTEPRYEAHLGFRARAPMIDLHAK